MRLGADSGRVSGPMGFFVHFFTPKPKCGMAGSSAMWGGEVCRVLRAARKKGYRLSLSVNTDFKGALQALREHHEESMQHGFFDAVKPNG